MKELLKGLRAAAEPTRLRILGLCAHAELTVSDLVDVLGQSQPRISRHLKLLVEAGLLVRSQDGPWAWYRLPDEGEGASLAQVMVDLLPADDRRHAADLKRLQSTSERWANRVADYFRQHAADWDRIRALHTDQGRVDRALMAALVDAPTEALLDIGTGAGHVLLLASREAQTAVGIDSSREMLNVARHNLFQAGLRHCQVRQADMLTLPFDDKSFSTITMNMVLHYADRPQEAILEAARVLRPGGKLIIVDFASHQLEELQDVHAHRWLGFEDAQVEEWCRKAGLVVGKPRRLHGGKLTVVLWSADRAANDQPKFGNPAARHRNA